ncbi:ROK family protein [Patescibacteria group bacterium]|nr:ROK family protein [Patescibacteria group bacterium]
MKNYLGLDIGGTKIAAGIVSADGTIHVKTRVETEAHLGMDGVLHNIEEAVSELGVDVVDGIGIGFAGQIDRKKGVVIYSPNMPTFRNIALVEAVRNRFGKILSEKKSPIVIDNDANAFALAEHTVGHGQGTQYFVAITIGTGVGGGVVVDGKIYHGSAFASELGHMTIEVDGRECSCSLKGHLEAYVSGLSIQKMYYEKTGDNKQAFDIEKVALKDNNSPEHYVYMKSGKYLGIGLASVVNLLDPEMIVIGGGVGRSRLLIEQARDVCYNNIFFKGRRPEILQSKLSNDAAIIGTAMLCHD